MLVHFLQAYMYFKKSWLSTSLEITVAFHSFLTQDQIFVLFFFKNHSLQFIFLSLPQQSAHSHTHADLNHSSLVC